MAKKLKYGVSVTDACVDWAMTLDMLDEVNEVCFVLKLIDSGINYM